MSRIRSRKKTYKRKNRLKKILYYNIMFIYKFKKLPFIFIYNAKCACSNIKNIINDIEKLYETNNF